MKSLWVVQHLAKLPKHQPSKLQEGPEQMELIVALDLLQHVKHLSEISDVACNCNTIFTWVQLAARRFLLRFCHWYGMVAQAAVKCK